MKKIKIESEFTVYASIDDLPDQVKSLMQEAVKARQDAYAPYSRFHVGAAILLDNGQIVTGSNQENASYPSGLCAERTAIFYAGSKFPKAKIKSLAITAASQNKKTKTPIPPCGACRQSISEYEVRQDQPIEIYFMGEDGEVVKSDSLANLLPFAFKKTSL